MAFCPCGYRYHAVRKAIDRMNQNPSNFRFVFGGMDDRDGVGENNGESEIYMRDLGQGFGKNSAVENSDSEFSPSCTATESDIVINTHYRMERPPEKINKLSPTHDKKALFAYGGSYAHLVSTVMHELGHSAGLNHEGDVMNLMGGNNLLVANGDSVEPYIGEDTAAGLIAMYGLSADAEEDVSVSHWRYGDKLTVMDGSSVSIHHRTRLFDEVGRELEKTCHFVNPDVNGLPIAACPEPVYKVKKGQAVSLELTYENAGKTTPITVNVQYVISGDDRIEPTDLTLMKSTLSLKRDGIPSTSKTRLKIPKTLVSGERYWLGCIIKLTTDSSKEGTVANNASYIEIEVE